ncbi:uncharacterized protein A4U43_C03F7720 [Asparagus officinalis]|uniref:MADS-box domain-containing protein n=1 Tax=Asparagus officinalis TaxID=4686 RepID=A0A5P1FA11_ASPOF|nr:uncharacterized protein A4U43_C03F7720 [Asparagus officinalis]
MRRLRAVGFRNTKTKIARKKKASHGRKKIAIQRIASEEARHVCFSKRRNSVFTKAADLSTLCGAEVVVIVNSPVGNPYSLGSPGVNQVIDRYSTRSPMPLEPNNPYRASRIGELNAQCMELSRRLDLANARKAEMGARVREAAERNPYAKLVDDIDQGLGSRELKVAEEALRGVRAQGERRLGELMRGGGASANNASMAVNPLRMMDGQFQFG